jgi:hypothetical protein
MKFEFSPSATAVAALTANEKLFERSNIAFSLDS